MIDYKHLKATRTNAFGEKSSVKSGLSNRGTSIKGVNIILIYPILKVFFTLNPLGKFDPSLTPTFPLSSLPTSFMYDP